MHITGVLIIIHNDVNMKLEEEEYSESNKGLNLKTIIWIQDMTFQVSGLDKREKKIDLIGNVNLQDEQ